MKHFTLVMVMVTMTCTYLSAQQSQTIGIGFEKTTLKVQKKATSTTYPILIKANSLGLTEGLDQYTVRVVVDEVQSTLPKHDYKLDVSSVTLSNSFSEHTFYLTIIGDTILERDRDRTLILNLKLEKKEPQTNVSLFPQNQPLTVTVEGVRSITKYSYLGHVGTNFDLIDGPKPKDLFFAINTFAPPKEEDNTFGFNLALYGNRTISSTDTVGSADFTTKIVPIGGDSARYFNYQALKSVTSVSDNLGAMFIPLFDLTKVDKSRRSTKFYYAPQFEFIYRRIKSTTEYKDLVFQDSIDRADRPFQRTITFPTKVTTPTSIYDLYLGLGGLFLSHENESISIRIQGSVGYKFSYLANYDGPDRGISHYSREGNVFGYVRTWITEPTTGITFGADISNTIFKEYYPYYNVTLSKAINISALGTIFQPLTSRPPAKG